MSNKQPTDQGAGGNAVDVSHGLAAELDSQDKMLREAIEVIRFYGDPGTYYAISFLPDPPSGDFIEDFEDTHMGYKPGKRARDFFNKAKLPANLNTPHTPSPEGPKCECCKDRGGYVSRSGGRMGLWQPCPENCPATCTELVAEHRREKLEQANRAATANPAPPEAVVAAELLAEIKTLDAELPSGTMGDAAFRQFVLKLALTKPDTGGDYE